MTKMDSYESSQGGIKQWKTRKDRSEANKLANEERATRQRTGRSRVRPGWTSGSVDQWIRSQDQAGCATSVRGAVPVSVVL